jgi:hypothetical protein
MMTSMKRKGRVNDLEEYKFTTRNKKVVQVIKMMKGRSWFIINYLHSNSNNRNISMKMNKKITIVKMKNNKRN